MAKQNVVYYPNNPYEVDKTAKCSVLYAPDEYKLNLLMVLPGIALRVLLFALAKLKPDGSVELNAVRMARLMKGDNKYINVGIRILIQHNLLQHHNRRSSYWLNPTLARPITIVIG